MVEVSGAAIVKVDTRSRANLKIASIARLESQSTLEAYDISKIMSNIHT